MSSIPTARPPFLSAAAVALSLWAAPTITPVPVPTPSPYYVHHAVSTSRLDAQRAFDKGLTFLYGFNRQAAEAQFRAAAAIDPRLAIAWWGAAMSLGPNINVRMSTGDMAAAARCAAKAKALEANASREERALIDALETRYAPGGDEAKLAGPYAQAMRHVARAYPDDPDVQALYLEGLLDALTLKSPMRGMPDWDGMEKVARTDVQRWPDHIGLLHYFIHVTEPDTSALAIQVADRLASFNFAPQDSHLTHMPSHVYVYVGEWAKVAALNHKAVEQDIEQAKAAATKPDDLDYFFHNLDFWYGGAVMLGDEALAREAAKVLEPYNRDAPWIVADRFGHFDEAWKLMQAADTPARLGKLPYRTVYFYGLLSAQMHKIGQAQRAITQIKDQFHSSDVRTLGLDILRGTIASAGGDLTKARKLYESAAALQDKMDFEDAPPWQFAPRELLARMELRAGDPSAAARAAQDDLKRYPHSALALALLANADDALGRTEDAEQIKSELQSEETHQ
jgi:hypothetical protein